MFWFFFGEDLLLRRHDYSVNIAGGFGAAQLTSDYAEANGICLPTKRRAYTRGPDRCPILEKLMVSIDILHLNCGSPDWYSTFSEAAFAQSPNFVRPGRSET